MPRGRHPGRRTVGRAERERAQGPPAPRSPAPRSLPPPATTLSPPQALRRARRLGHRPPIGEVVQREIESEDFKGYLQEQLERQEWAQYDEEAFTTVGFEHEFAQVADGPLSGVTHVEIATSGLEMPFTGIPFHLETDANDALELVSPPFLIDTVSDTAPIPDSADVGKVDDMISERLAEVTVAEQTLGDLLGKLDQNPGIDFAVLNPQVGPSNVNPGAPDFSELEHTPSGKAVVPGKSLLETKVTHGRKSSLSGGISAQVNFATDAPTYHDVQMGTAPIEHSQAVLFRGLESRVFGLLLKNLVYEPTQPRSSAFEPFLLELARRLAGTLAVRSIDWAERAKQEIFEGGHSGRQASNKYGKGKESNLYDLHTGLRSYVKDTRNLWLKDTLENFGLGTLTADDWRHVARLGVSKSLHADLQDMELPGGTGGKTGKELRLNLETAKPLMVRGLQDLSSRVLAGKWYSSEGIEETRQSISGPKKQPEFGSHDPGRLGVRQDTFLPQQTLVKSRPKRWKDRRLHVVETRGESLQTLLDATITHLLRTTKDGDDTIAVSLGKRIKALQAGALDRLIAAEKRWGKKGSKPSDVKVLEKLVEQRERLVADAERVAEIRGNLGIY